MLQKEFYKFRLFYYGLCLIYAVFCLYFYLQLRLDMLSSSRLQLNLSFLLEGKFSFSYLLELNMATALCIGSLVAYRERELGRMRLSLLLPRRKGYIISYLLLTGLAFVFALYLLIFIYFYFMLGFFYEQLIREQILSVLLANYLFCAVLYLYCFALLLEPSRLRACLHFVLLLISGKIYYHLNPEIYAQKSFYENDYAFIYLALMLIYSLLSALLVFSNYQRGYIK